MPQHKIVLIGSGHVGSAFAHLVVSHGLVDKLAIIDIDQAKAEADVMDLNHATPFSPRATQVYVGDYSDCSDADIVVICASAKLAKGETRLKLLEDNVQQFIPMIKQVIAHGFDGHFVLPSNPVDIMSYVVKQLSNFPKNKVIGSGTILDSSRFEYLIAQEFNIAPQQVYAPVIGEHGDSQVAVWSHATIAGESVQSHLSQTDNVEERMSFITEKTKNIGYDIYQRKGTTCFGIASGLLTIISAILFNEQKILNVSSFVEGEYNLSNLYLGTPTLINANGAEKVIELQLTEEESQQLEQSAHTLRTYQQIADDLIEAHL